MPRETGHGKAGSKSPARSDRVAFPTPWDYASEMESMKKKTEQHSQDLALLKSSLCGLQRKITEKMNGLESLVQRVEALDSAKAPDSRKRDQEHTRGLHHRQFIERLDTMTVSMTELETRFELLRGDTATQLATFEVALEHQWKEFGGKEFLPTGSEVQGCILKASTHAARLENLHEKLRETQAMPGITEQVPEVVEDVALQCTQTILPPQKVGSLPQLLEPAKRTSPHRHASLHTSASDSGVGKISPTSPRGSLRSVCSLGRGFSRKAGIVNSRIQHFEGRIQEVGKTTLPDGTQQSASPGARLPPPEHFHALQRAAPSAHGEPAIIPATSTPRFTTGSPPWLSHAATTVQRLSSHSPNASESMVKRESSQGPKTSESCGGSTGSTYVSSAGESLETPQASFTVSDNMSQSSLDKIHLIANRTCLPPNDPRRSLKSAFCHQAPAACLLPGQPMQYERLSPRSPTCTGMVSTIEKLKAAMI